MLEVSMILFGLSVVLGCWLLNSMDSDRKVTIVRLLAFAVVILLTVINWAITLTFGFSAGCL